MKFKAAIFDMDGLLLDTEQVRFDLLKQTCQDLGLPFHEQAYLSCIGTNATTTEQILFKAYGGELERLQKEWNQRYDAIAHHQAIPLKTGVVDLLTWLQANQIPTGVATSTKRDLAEIKLQLAGLDGYFDSITTGCEIERGKPHPDIFLLAAQRLGIEAKQCIAFEDSNNGVRAAVAADMTTYQIPDLIEPCDAVLALGHQVYPSLSVVLGELRAAEMTL